MSDTIAAIATSAAPAGIGVIRISGDGACTVADRVFKATGGKTTESLNGYTAAYGHVYDLDGTLIDEAVALRFRAPHSYTGEDVVELSCHGGTYLLRRTLRAVLGSGARMADAGEFTRRAFLNGKLDLTAAESVMDLIGAASEQAHKAALFAKNGGIFTAASKIKQKLLTADSSLAAWVDFPDEEVPEVDENVLRGQLSEVSDDLSFLVKNAENGRIIRSGVHTVIAGKPNVGKSSVMNLLLRCDRSIVTDIAGTTRDVIEESVSVGGTLLRLADTAGLRDTLDPVESAGIGIAHDRIDTADLVIAVFDRSRPLDNNDFDLIKRLKGRNFVAVINKSDLPKAFDPAQLGLDKYVEISAKNGDVAPLEKAVTDAVGVDKFDAQSGAPANERQLGCVTRCLAAVNDAIAAIDGKMTLDAVGVCVDDALAALCELTGEKVSDSVIDDVFSRFCVGK